MRKDLACVLLARLLFHDLRFKVQTAERFDRAFLGHARQIGNSHLRRRADIGRFGCSDRRCALIVRIQINDQKRKQSHNKHRSDRNDQCYDLGAVVIARRLRRHIASLLRVPLLIALLLRIAVGRVIAIIHIQIPFLFIYLQYTIFR